MELAPHFSIERCRLVEYNNYNHVMDRSFDLDEVIKFTCISSIVIIMNIVSASNY